MVEYSLTETNIFDPALAEKFESMIQNELSQ
ncbi:MAG: hypothetical protein K0Q73_8093, partial [Paenibacillus sp.]|nr:hypothetical protein [Paenibacillus sp.]